eukprot:CAMPEP_0194393514 /NCGR_PEP_ID=MMETSP0174-20130528/123339_1 /TAXON_ID=216777 /ORGANISM="Proboscia alata, Strain PI-D3" /LENGTH=660 /DNA_ID=CAMNT_0039189205 /DNA_START=134 /DNA_END=2115 /DNA_ORIENTATION=+
MVSQNTTSKTKSSSKATPTIDMSCKIGGRTVRPAFQVVDANPTPSPSDERFNQLLSSYSTQNISIESTVGLRKRERVLDRLKHVCQTWIKDTCRKQGLGEDICQSAGGQIYTSGSYRLGVHEPGADIDTILVAPSMCTRLDFFGTLDEEGKRDPSSLSEMVRQHPDVTNLVPVEGAAVPILTFDWEGVNIDLLFATLSSSSVPSDFDIDDDAVLDGVDSATEKSLNGPRVTNLIAKLVSGTKERYQTYLTVVRCVRKWAKARGLYSNKMGYWGGVNINIAVAFVLQLYPTALPAALLRKFFLVFKFWRWPDPIKLTEPHDAGLGVAAPVWTKQGAAAQRQVAPIITPAYPAMNSTMSASSRRSRLCRRSSIWGHDIVNALWKRVVKSVSAEDNQEEEIQNETAFFAELFEPSDFFISYQHYLSLCIVGPTIDDLQPWAGFCGITAWKLVSDLLGKSLPLSKIQLWPKKFDACIVDPTAGKNVLNSERRKKSISYSIGFNVDTLRMRGKQLDIERQMQNFRKYELVRFPSLVPGQDILTRAFDVKELPRICFVGMYPSKEHGMKKRRRIRNADPRRIEQKLKAKLARDTAALKVKMMALEKKKMDVLAAKKKAKGKKDEKNQESEETVVDENDKTKTDAKDEPNETIADNDRDAKASKEET